MGTKDKKPRSRKSFFWQKHFENRKEWLPIKEMVSIKRNDFDIKAATKKNGFHQKEPLPLNKMASTERNGFH